MERDTGVSVPSLNNFQPQIRSRRLEHRREMDHQSLSVFFPSVQDALLALKWRTILPELKIKKKTLIP